MLPIRLLPVGLQHVTCQCVRLLVLTLSKDQGQGAVQALEDAASLSVVLPAGTHLAAVPERLRLYERIRSKRAHTIQAYSREAGKDVAEGEKPEVNSMTKPKAFH